MQPKTPITILTGASTAEHEVKKSLFQAFAEPLASPDEFAALLHRYHDSDARHHCWAWRCNGEYRFSDDGEPSGTAGRPILQAMEGAGIERALVVVRRYFGGIKLGAGGLVRAYSAAAALCLADANTRALTPHVPLKLEVPFEHTQALFRILAPYSASPPHHSTAGVSVEALVPQAEQADVLAELRNQSRGQIQVTLGDITLA